MTYEELLNEATSLDIKVKEAELKTNDGYCHGNRIAINKKLETRKEKLCVLAEELGHYHLTVGNISDQSKIENVKQELIARRWSYRKLAGLIDIINAHKKGVRDRFEMAEELGVTDEFLNEDIEYYRNKYGHYHIIDSYMIRFIPSFGICELF